MVFSREGGLQQTRARRTRRAILDAAAEVFGRQGYDGTALSDILEAAGVTKGALYFHFTSKRQVAEVVLEEEAAQWAGLASRAQQGAPGLQGLIDFSFAVARHIQGSPVAHAGVRLRRDGSGFSGPWGAPEESCAALGRGFLRRARTDRELRGGVDCDAAADTVVAAVIGAQLLDERVPGGPALEDRISAVWRLLLPGIVPESRSADYRVSAPEPLAGDGDAAGLEAPTGPAAYGPVS